MRPRLPREAVFLQRGECGFDGVRCDGQKRRDLLDGVVVGMVAKAAQDAAEEIGSRDFHAGSSSADLQRCVAPAAAGGRRDAQSERRGGDDAKPAYRRVAGSVWATLAPRLGVNAIATLSVTLRWRRSLARFCFGEPHEQGGGAGLLDRPRAGRDLAALRLGGGAEAAGGGRGDAHRQTVCERARELDLDDRRGERWRCSDRRRGRGRRRTRARRVTFSQSLSTMSTLSASTVSVPKPQAMLSTSPSRASIWSLP